MKNGFLLEKWLAAVAWVFLNIFLIASMFSVPVNTPAVSFKVGRMPKEITAMIRTPDASTVENKQGLGSLPGLQISYPSEAEIIKIAGFYGMKPLIISDRNQPLFLIDVNGRTMTRVNDSKMLSNYSPRVRRVQCGVFNPYLNKAGEITGLPVDTLSVVFLVSKNVEDGFINKQVSVMSTLGLNSEDVVVLRGRYMQKDSGYDLFISEVVCKDGTVKQVKG